MAANADRRLAAAAHALVMAEREVERARRARDRIDTALDTGNASFTELVRANIALRRAEEVADVVRLELLAARRSGEMRD